MLHSFLIWRASLKCFTIRKTITELCPSSVGGHDSVYKFAGLFCVPTVCFDKKNNFGTIIFVNFDIYYLFLYKR